MTQNSPAARPLRSSFLARFLLPAAAGALVIAAGLYAEAFLFDRESFFERASGCETMPSEALLILALCSAASILPALAGATLGMRLGDTKPSRKLAFSLAIALGFTLFAAVLMNSADNRWSLPVLAALPLPIMLGNAIMWRMARH